MIFFRKRRIEKLKRRIEILQVEMAVERQMEQISKTCYPTVRVNQARELAELQYDLRKLQEAA